MIPYKKQNIRAPKRNLRPLFSDTPCNRFRVVRVTLTTGRLDDAPVTPYSFPLVPSSILPPSCAVNLAASPSGSITVVPRTVEAYVTDINFSLDARRAPSMQMMALSSCLLIPALVVVKICLLNRGRNLGEFCIKIDALPAEDDVPLSNMLHNGCAEKSDSVLRLRYPSDTWRSSLTLSEDSTDCTVLRRHYENLPFLCERVRWTHCDFERRVSTACQSVFAGRNKVNMFSVPPDMRRSMHPQLFQQRGCYEFCREAKVPSPSVFPYYSHRAATKAGLR